MDGALRAVRLPARPVVRDDFDDDEPGPVWLGEEEPGLEGAELRRESQALVEERDLRRAETMRAGAAPRPPAPQLGEAERLESSAAMNEGEASFLEENARGKREFARRQRAEAARIRAAIAAATTRAA